MEFKVYIGKNCIDSFLYYFKEVLLMAVEWTKEQMKYFIQEYKKLNTPLVWDALFVQYGYRNQVLRKEVRPI